MATDLRLRQPKAIKVGVFPPDDSCRSYRAYTRYYLTSWPGCCEHEVEAINGTDAKALAIQEHKDQCED